MFNSWIQHAIGAGFVLAMSHGTARADQFDGVVDSPSSLADLSGIVDIHTTGTLIGDYDAETNPDGTSTIPGFFGGSGNNPISIDLSGAVETNLNTTPSGSMSIDIDFENFTIDFENLVVDILGGQSGAAQPVVSMVYETFHTTSPSFIYPGGIPFEIPLGEGSTIDQAIASQTGSAFGVIVPSEIPDVFEFDLAIPAELDVAFTLGFGDFQTPDEGFDPLPIILPLSGIIERRMDGTVHLSMNIDLQQFDASTPIEGVTTPEIPFELPTLGSDTAGVLFTLVPDLLTVELQYSWALYVIGTPAECSADINNDGSLDFFDISGFLSAFGSGDPAADFTGDGAYDFFDISAFLTAYSAGCP